MTKNEIEALETELARALTRLAKQITMHPKPSGFEHTKYWVELTQRKLAAALANNPKAWRERATASPSAATREPGLAPRTSPEERHQSGFQRAVQAASPLRPPVALSGEAAAMATPRMAGELAPELARVLLPLYSPCPGFTGACKGSVTWNPAQGHIPRAFLGATGRLDEVRLVLVCAEPGDPYGYETHPTNASPAERVLRVHTKSTAHIEDRVGRFESNIRLILDLAWPGMSFQEQMRRTWITESVFCSAAREGGSVPRRVEQECMGRYFLAQTNLFSKARVVALGRKAQDRLARARVPFRPAVAASPPGCNLPEAKGSWKAAVSRLTD